MRMPVWSEQGRRPVPTAENTAVRIDPDRLAAPVSAAAAKVTDAAVSLGEEFQRQQRKGEAVEAAKQYAQVTVDWSKTFEEMKAAAPEGGAGLMDQMLAHADEDTKARLEAAPASARPWLEVRLANLRAAVADQAMTYEAGARVAKQSRDLQSIIDITANRVRSDFRGMDEALALADTAIEASSLTAEGKAKSRELARSVITEAGINGLTDTNPAAALQALRSGTYDAVLDPARKDRLMAQAEQDIRRREAEARARAAEARADARAEVEPALRDEMTAYSRGDRVAAPVSDAQIRAAYTPDRAEALIRDRANWRSYATDLASVAMLPPSEQDALLSKHKPEGGDYAAEAERFDGLARAVATDRKHRLDDPAAYVMRHSPRLQQAFQEAGADPAKLRKAAALSLQLQGEAGIPETNRRLLPDMVAKGTVQELAAAPAESRADRIQSMAQTYGDLWPRVFRELQEAKLPDEYEVLASTAEPTARVRLSASISAGKEALRSGLGTGARDVDKGVDEALHDLRVSFAPAENGAAIADRYTNAVRLLAYDYARTMDAAAAAKRAADEVVMGRYDWVKQGDLMARVPKGQKEVALRHAAHLLDALKPGSIADEGGNAKLTPEQRRAILLDAARDGHWVTNERDDGWVRLDSRRVPVRLADGKRLEFRFADIPAATVALAAAGQERGSDAPRIARQSGLTEEQVRINEERRRRALSEDGP